MRLRFHTQTLGSTLVRQDPLNNIVRGGLQALAAVLGGTQSLHVSGYDEAYDIPSEEAMRLSLATQLIIAHETGVTGTVDPLGGSWFLESLTNTIEEKAWEYIHRIEHLGGGSLLQGMLQAIEGGYIEREIARASYEYQRGVEGKEHIVVGVNQYQPDPESSHPPQADGGRLELFQFDPEEEERQKRRLAEAKGSRSQRQVIRALRTLKEAAGRDQNLMPAVLEAVQVGATEGETMDVLRDVYGEYVDPGVF
jgi:methylmalonyl-CoA mutase N-terminal domain/subunit